MKIKLEHDETLSEDEIIIKSNNNPLSEKLAAYAEELLSRAQTITAYKDTREFFITADKILFFETQDEDVYAHTTDDLYRVTARLYELEETLPSNFLRVSKSAIVNVSQIFSVGRGISTSSLIEFSGTNKQIYASRKYTKQLKQRLNILKGE